MNDEKRYNVYIVDNKGNAVALIGEELVENQADRRELTGLSQINRENYFVTSIEVGSKEDRKSKKEVEKVY